MKTLQALERYRSYTHQTLLRTEYMDNESMENVKKGIWQLALDFALYSSHEFDEELDIEFGAKVDESN